MSTIVIATTALAAEKIATVTYDAGKLIVAMTGDAEPLIWSDPDRTLFCKALQDWKDYLADRQARWLEAIQYGTALAAERGRIA
jgi:hypothetical protein